MRASFDIAIIGYGPVGAVAAGLLGQAGYRVYVCDRLTDVHTIPRAFSLDHEIMRLFQQLGVADQVAEYCEPFTPSEFYGVDGQLIRRMTMTAPPYPQGYTPSMVFSQPPVERILRARVAQLPNVTVALGTTFEQLAQDDDSVTLHLRDLNGVTNTIQARYVIACDGGGSPVRTQLNLPLEDLDFDEAWLVVDALVNPDALTKLPQVSVQYCEPARPCTYLVGPKNHRRWEISLLPGEDPQAAATPERTWQLLARWLTPADGQLWRQASYRFHALVASQWRQGRVFLAGDAAHMQPPFLGQGMCQGIRDAANLTWKLDHVLRGVAGDQLLATYGEERCAHVRELTTRIKGVGSLICERDVDKARTRDARLLTEAGGQVRDTPRQDILPKLSTGLIAEEAHEARGSLFPQPWLLVDGVRRRMDEVVGNGWRLVVAENVALDAPLPTVPELTVVRIGAPWVETEGVVANWFARHACVAALVRPDNYVYGTATHAREIVALYQGLRIVVQCPVSQCEPL